MATNTRTIAFTGGGTAGHVFPAFPVVHRAQQAGFEVVWIGSRQGMERSIVEEAGIPYYGVPSGKLRRYWSWKNFSDIFRIIQGFFASLRILGQIQPVLIVSKGGFVSVPPVAAARLRRIPAITHESDVDPGLATRLNLRLGALPLLAYEQTRSYLPKSAGNRALVTGNPVRDILFHGNRQEGRRLAGLSPEDPRPLILVLGGSQGAREVNHLITGSLDQLLQAAAIVHQTGKGNPAVSPRPGYHSQPFFTHELPHLFAAADLAIGRSGGGMTWELAATGTPAIFIPLREATRGDQLLNAEMAAAAGFALILGDKASPLELADTVIGLIGDSPRMEAMKRAAKAFPAREAADRIFEVVKERAK